MRNRFLYYIPRVAGCNGRKLSDVGLRDRFVNAGGDGFIEHGITPTIEGPEGSGVLVAIGTQPAEYAPSRQQWLQGKAFWVGLENGFPPSPMDLVRESGFSGYEVRLLDGNNWTVPLLRRWNQDRCEHVSALPKCIRPIEGRMREAVVPRYIQYDSMAERIWNSFVNEDSFTLEQLFANSAELLSANYRIGVEEIGMQGLIDSALALEVQGLAIDVNQLRAHAEAIAFDGLVVNVPNSEEAQNG